MGTKKLAMRRAPGIWFTAFIAMGMLSLGARADAVDGESGIEEVIVTAQKREQSVQDVGISITALSGTMLENAGIDSATDIAQVTPSLSITQFHPSFTTINIRGVSQNDFGDQLEPPVAVFVDGVYVSAMGAAAAQLYDVERVEVLRGPQGTLFGRNATGGLVHYVSRKPTAEFDAFGTVTIAEYDRVAFQGAVGGGMTENSSGRVAVSVNTHDGWWENRSGKDLRDAESYAVRGQWSYEPAAEWSALIRLHYASDDSTGGGYIHGATVAGPDGLGRDVGENELARFPDFLGGTFTTCPGCDAFGYREPDRDSRTGAANQEGEFVRDIAGGAATVEWSRDELTVTSITDYMTMNKEYKEDTEGSPLTQVDFFTGENFRQFSQELRASIQGERTLWTAGAYYLDIDNNVVSGVDPQDIGPFVGAPPGFVFFGSRQSSDVDTSSWAVFGHAEHQFTEQWSAIAAIRYTEDTRKVNYHLGDNFGTDQAFNQDLFPSLAKLTFENVSAKLELDWRPSEDVLLYGGWTRGHKAGNFSLPFIGPVADLTALPHDEEVLESFEAGTKVTFLDGRAQLNAGAFYYDYEDYQASFFVSIVQIIRNLDASAYGGEIELALQPVDGMNISLGASFLESEVDDVGMPDGTLQDRNLPNAPSYSLNGMAGYTWPAWSGELSVGADFKYTDNFCFTVVCHPDEREGGYVLANARVSYAWDDGRWKATFFVDNISDTDYRVFSLDSSVLGFSQQAGGAPRWIGGSIAWQWR